MECPKCGNELLLGAVLIDTIYPHDEPYESGELVEVEEICVGEKFLVHYCENCNIIHDIWDDEQVHLIRVPHGASPH